MKTHNRLSTTIVLMIACLVLAASAMASTEVYNNGPFSNVDGWTINFGYSVGDSFYLGASTQLTGFVFYVWEFPGDSLSSVNYQVSIPGGAGSGLPFGTACSVLKLGCTALLKDTYLGGMGYDMDQITVTFPPSKALQPGTYLLTLSQAAVPSGDPVFWDENSGVGCTGWKLTKEGCPSQARENEIGTIASESFSIWGN